MELSRDEILEYQKNRDPYLLIDYVTNVDPGKSADGYLDLNESKNWILDVHWPNDRNLPGMLQIEALIQMGADVNVQARGRRSTPLHFAGGMGHLGVVQCLLSHGANPLARDEDGWTPSDVAARMMSSEMENQNGPVAPATWKHIIETLS